MNFELSEDQRIAPRLGSRVPRRGASVRRVAPDHGARAARVRRRRMAALRGDGLSRCTASGGGGRPGPRNDRRRDRARRDRPSLCSRSSPRRDARRGASGGGGRTRARASRDRRGQAYRDRSPGKIRPGPGRPSRPREPERAGSRRQILRAVRRCRRGPARGHARRPLPHRSPFEVSPMPTLDVSQRFARVHSTMRGTGSPTLLSLLASIR